MLKGSKEHFCKAQIPFHGVGGAKPLSMERKSIIRFLQSFVVFPVLATNFMLSPLAMNVEHPTAAVLSSEQTRTQLIHSADNQQNDVEEMAAKIDAYYKDIDSPLEGYGYKLALSAKKNGLPLATLAALAVRESTAGLNDCDHATNNPFGYGSCKISFDTMDAAIEQVGRTLGGNSPKTAYHYTGNLHDKLEAYNGKGVVKQYPEQVMAIMTSIEEYQVS